VLSIELWKTYLLYVKETKSSLSTYKEKMAQAYDFALDKMGLDIQSNALWNDYINFLKESPLLLPTCNLIFACIAIEICFLMNKICSLHTKTTAQ
jgi:hypothetical protein